MRYTTQQLKEILHHRYHEEGWPAKRNAMIQRFKESTVVVSIEVEKDNKSYIQLFCHKKNQELNNSSETDFENGISVLLSDYAPVAAYGATHFSITAYTTLTASEAYKIPAGSWNREIMEIKNILRAFDVSLFAKAILNQKMQLEALCWPDNYNVFEYNLFDVFFHWPD